MSKNKSKSGPGFLGLLTIAFIVLKLLGKIDWSWWRVWSPMWIYALVILVYLLLARALKKDVDLDDL